MQAESDGVGTMEKTWQTVGGSEFKNQTKCLAGKDAPNHHLGLRIRQLFNVGN